MHLAQTISELGRSIPHVMNTSRGADMGAVAYYAWLASGFILSRRCRLLSFAA